MDLAVSFAFIPILLRTAMPKDNTAEKINWS